MDCKIEKSEKALKVFISGRLTFNDHSDFQTLLENDIAEASRVIFDFQGLDFIDSSGIGMILIASEELSKRGGVLSLQGYHGQVENVFNVTRLNDLINRTVN